jgi:hypothetical protein
MSKRLIVELPSNLSAAAMEPLRAALEGLGLQIVQEGSTLRTRRVGPTPTAAPSTQRLSRQGINRPRTWPPTKE